MRRTPHQGRLVAALLAVAAAGAAGALGAGASETTVRAESRSTVRALEAALLLSGQEGGSIRTAVLAVPFPTAGDPARVAMLVEVEGAPLAGDLETGELTVDLFVYALSSDAQEVVASVSRRVTLELSRHGARLRQTGLKLPAALELPPGEHLLRILVRTQAGIFGIRSTELTVPGPETGGALPPLFPEPAGRWLLGLAEPGSGLEPFAAGGEPFLPAALPVIEAGEPAAGLLLVPEVEARELAATALLKHNDTGELHEVRLTLAEPLTTPAEGLSAIPFELPTAGLAAGVYTVRAAHGGAGRGSAATPSTVIALAVAAAGRAWPEVELGDSAPRAGAEVAQGPPAGTRAAGQAPPATADALQEAHAALAAGDLDEAAARLGALHRAAIRPRSPVTLTELEAAESQLAQKLAAEDPGRLLPLLCLYAELADGYHRTRQLRLGTHAGRLAHRTAASYVRAEPSPGAGGQAAHVLSSLGGSLMKAGALGDAVAAFEAALAWTEDHAGALLGLAAVQEKQGRFGDAAATLERLTAARPEHAEATLRLALNLRRIDRGERAAALLERLTETAAPAWVAQLAYQEAARLALDGGRLQRAEQLLRRGLERWPREPSLTIFLAWVLDRRRRPREADRLLELADRAGELASARYRYNEWPRETAQLEPASVLGERRPRQRPARPDGGAGIPGTP